MEKFENARETKARETKKLKPSFREIQRGVIEEEIRGKLTSLNYDKAISSGVEEQCQERFGIGWEEVRKKLDSQISEGFELTLPNKDGSNRLLGKIDPQEIIRLIQRSGGSGTWITNSYLEVLYLRDRFRGPQRFSEEDLKKLTESLLDPTRETELDILDAASALQPEQVQQVLSSYGFDTDENKTS